MENLAVESWNPGILCKHMIFLYILVIITKLFVTFFWIIQSYRSYIPMAEKEVTTQSWQWALMGLAGPWAMRWGAPRFFEQRQRLCRGRPSWMSCDDDRMVVVSTSLRCQWALSLRLPDAPSILRYPLVIWHSHGKWMEGLPLNNGDFPWQTVK
jgi:hypothetical protein